jgi:hypothetical protein
LACGGNAVTSRAVQLVSSSAIKDRLNPGRNPITTTDVTPTHPLSIHTDTRSHALHTRTKEGHGGTPTGLAAGLVDLLAMTSRWIHVHTTQF